MPYRIRWIAHQMPLLKRRYPLLSSPLLIVGVALVVRFAVLATLHTYQLSPPGGFKPGCTAELPRCFVGWQFAYEAGFIARWLTLGYGYQPWRALIGLVAAVGIAVILAVVLGDHGALAQVRTPPTPASVACTVVERIGVGLDVAAPLVATNSAARCAATDTATGQALTISGWILRLLAWGFATLFVAGFTSAVRKT